MIDDERIPILFSSLPHEIITEISLIHNEQKIYKEQIWRIFFLDEYIETNKIIEFIGKCH